MKHLFIFFFSCNQTKDLWCKLREYLAGKLDVPFLLPQSAIFGLFDVQDKDYAISNHLLLIFKYHVYKSRTNKTLTFQRLKSDISKIKNIEKTLGKKDLTRQKKFSKKWRSIDELF